MYDKKGKEKQNLDDYFIANNIMYDDLSTQVLCVNSIDVEKLDEPNFRITISFSDVGPKYKVSCNRAKIVFAKADGDFVRVHIITDTNIKEELEKLASDYKNKETTKPPKAGGR